jgi:hypothetical protein
MSAHALPRLLQIGEFVLNKDEFTLTHAYQRKDSSGRKRRIEYACDECTDVYVTMLRDEVMKDYPWLCRSCRSKKLWQVESYRKAIMNGITDETRQFRRLQRSVLAKKMWADPTKRANLCLKLRRRPASVYSKARSVIRRSQKIAHWLTGEELICVGSYEFAFVNWCNANHIDFDWQISHRMPDERQYIIDAFVKTGEFANTWVEIKGRLFGIGKEKWEWFHAEHPNDSQLWTNDVLNQKGISVK